MIREETLKFLKNLAENNRKEWVDQHREACDAAKEDFEATAAWLIAEVSKFDPLVARMRLVAKRSVSRLNRDTRFHRGLPSYKTEILCVANHKGRKGTTAGYFVRVAADGCAVGGGVLAPRAPDLRRYRERVSGYHDELEKILEGKAFRRACPHGLWTADKLKKHVPEGFDADDPAAELLKLKHFTTYESLTDAAATSKAGEKKMRDVLKASHALVDFLNEA